MANTMQMGDIDAFSAYRQSFGAMPHKTTYQKVDLKSLATQQPSYEVDKREEINTAFKAGLKAQLSTSGGAGTAGYAMVPIYVDPRIVDRTRKTNPLVELIPRVSNQGVTADYNVITAKGGAFTAVENAALAETNTTYARQTTAIKYLYAVGAVSGVSMAAQPSYVLAGMMPSGGAVGYFSDQSATNSMQQEVLVKTREIKELEENLIVNGNKSTSGVSGDPNGTEYDGIIAIMSTTNTVAKSTTALSLDDYDSSLQKAFDAGGRPSLGVASSAAFTDTQKLLNAKIGFMTPSVQTQWGFSALLLNTIVGQIMLIPSMFLSNTSGSKAIYFLDLSVVEMRVLQDLTYQELAQTNDARKFMLKIYEALIIRAPTFCSSITAIA